jgi:hypothetical protein
LQIYGEIAYDEDSDQMREGFGCSGCFILFNNFLLPNLFFKLIFCVIIIPVGIDTELHDDALN